jgi:hypothetical protein
MIKDSIILVESNLTRVTNIRSNINVEFQILIRNVGKFSELLSSIQQDRPQLIILGKFDEVNYLEVGKEIHKIQANLPIVLLCRNLILLDSYRDALQDAGITAIAEHSYEKLNQILDKLDRPIVMYLDRPIFTGETILSILQEIVFVSSNHLSLSVIGNHWQKTHQNISPIFPSLENWSVDSLGKVSCQKSMLAWELTDEDIQGLKLWVKQFIEEGERTNAGFREILNTSSISLLAKCFLEAKAV